MIATIGRSPRRSCSGAQPAAAATFSVEAQPARSPPLIAKAIISGNASGVQANAGMPIVAKVLATRWSKLGVPSSALRAFDPWFL